MKDKLLIKRIATAIFGLSIIGIGIGITLKANLGVDPVSVMQTGLAKQFNMSYGNANALSSLVIIVFIFLIDRKYLSVATFLALFLIAYVADLTLFLLGGLTIHLLFFEVVGLLLGIILIAAGVAIYTQVNLGAGAVDAVSMLISDKTEYQYRWVRMACDFSFLLAGVLLQGAIGLGTVLIALFTGPLIQWFLPHTNFLKQ